MFWSSRAMARVLLLSAPDGKFWDEFVKDSCLLFFGFRHGAALAPEEDDPEEHEQ